MFSDSELNQLASRRALRAIAYVMLAVAGVCAFFVAPRTLNSVIGLMTWAWAAFLLVGGTLSAVGSIFDRWIGEFAGIPLLTSALTVYGTALITAGRTAAAGAVGCLMWALALSLFGRWRDVRGLVTAAPTKYRP